MNKPNSFPKAEHLCGEKRIARLYTQGEAFMAYPFRVVFRIEQRKELAPASIMVSVPKKRFKRAVKRNRLKRLLREAYRLNKHALIELLEEKRFQVHVAFNYVSDEELDFATVEKKMKIALQKLIDKIKVANPVAADSTNTMSEDSNL
ncbi:MAG TPA: ribonuclease P protein component [Paludibacter sp.]|jgi:ribonuclease P protein component